MADFNVENPTGKGKAVRAEGGFVVIKAGAKASVSADWSEKQVAGYEAVGLKVKAKAAPKAEKSDTK